MKALKNAVLNVLGALWVVSLLASLALRSWEPAVIGTCLFLLGGACCADRDVYGRD